MFLDSNLDYQQKRVGERFEQDRRTFYQELLELGGERATEIFYVFEALTFRFFQSRRDAQDGEAIAGIECLRRSFSPIHVPEPSPPAFGEELKKEFKVLGERQTPGFDPYHGRPGPGHEVYQSIFGGGLTIQQVS